MAHLAVPSRSSLNSRKLVLAAALIAAAAVLLAEVALLLPRALEVWHPYDYSLCLEMGKAARQGINPIGPRHYYPLPTVLWIFIPLSLLPDWFRLVWILVPIIFILRLFRRQGILLLGFVPLWFAMGDAMLDGWLLIPLLWLIEDRPVLAGLGAVAMLLKPQLAVLTVAYMFVRWVVTREWGNLGAFAVALLVFVLPAFIFDPNWIARMLAVLPLRANESISLLPLLTSSVWAWWWIGGLGKFIFVVIVLAAGILLLRALRVAPNRASAFQLLSLILVPVLFASNLITVAPILRGQREIIVVVLVSLGAFALDRAAGGFGGGYTLVPLAALYFRTRRVPA
jgi:hypothetical protein